MADSSGDDLFGKPSREPEFLIQSRKMQELFKEPEWLIQSRKMQELFKEPEWLIQSCKAQELFKEPEWLIQSRKMQELFKEPEWLIQSRKAQELFKEPEWLIQSRKAQELFKEPEWLTASRGIEELFKEPEWLTLTRVLDPVTETDVAWMEEALAADPATVAPLTDAEVVAVAEAVETVTEDAEAASPEALRLARAWYLVVLLAIFLFSPEAGEYAQHLAEAAVSPEVVIGVLLARFVR